MPRLIRWGNLQAAPWKNGGGTAVDLVVSPPGTDLDAFAWRLNVATIDRSGPFSDYPGIDRDFRVLDGGPLALHVGRSTFHLQPGEDGVTFPGDMETRAELAGPPCRAFNVLTRRGVVTATVERRTVEGVPTIDGPVPGGTLAVVLLDGRVVVAGAPGELEPLDTVVADSDVELVTIGPAHTLVVRVVPV